MKYFLALMSPDSDCVDCWSKELPVGSVCVQRQATEVGLSVPTKPDSKRLVSLAAYPSYIINWDINKFK
jgi:hypothetical protein